MLTSLAGNSARLPDPLKHLADMLVVPVAEQVPNIVDVHLHGIHEPPLLDELLLLLLRAVRAENRCAENRCPFSFLGRKLNGHRFFPVFRV